MISRIILPNSETNWKNYGRKEEDSWSGQENDAECVQGAELGLEGNCELGTSYVVWKLQNFSFLILWFCFIESWNLALERSALHRKCDLEQIQLLLLEGDLKHVPMEEVCTACPLFSCKLIGYWCWIFGYRIWEKKETWMWHGDCIQRAKQVLDYGIQVDFESIDEDNLKEVQGTGWGCYEIW